MDDNIKERRMPSFRELIEGFSKQTLENYIDFYLNKLKDGYHEHVDANLALMINLYEEKYIKGEEHEADSHTMQRFNEFKDIFNKNTKNMRYSQ